MTKGTASFGKKNKKTHIACRRCGRHTYHIRHKVCSACGFGKSAKMNDYKWKTKTISRQRKK